MRAPVSDNDYIEPTPEQQHFICAYLYNDFPVEHINDIRTALNVHERTYLDNYLRANYIYDSALKHYDRRPDQHHLYDRGPDYYCSECDNYFESRDEHDRS